MSRNRPPPSITPGQFFTEWLPREFTHEFGPGRRSAADITVAVYLDGDEGGEWTLDIGGGRLSVREAGAPGPSPVVTLWMSVEDFRAVFYGEEGAEIDLWPPQTSALDVLWVDPASRQIMTAVRGVVRFELTGYHGRTWSMNIRFGADVKKSEPSATISLDAATYGAILARKLMPPEAYFSGKIRLSGDTALAMQLAMAMLPRFTEK